MYEDIDPKLKEKGLMMKNNHDWMQLNKKAKFDGIRPIRKKHDIDTRLMELQAKIDLIKAMRFLPIGHGKFDFEEM